MARHADAMQKIILASGSERRKKLLKQIHLPFKAMIPGINEERYPSKDPIQMTRDLALEKAKTVSEKLRPGRRKWIFGLDTVIDFHGEIIGKPRDRDDAGMILERLSGQDHRVVTGIALIPDAIEKPIIESCISRVCFRMLSAAEISLYLNTGEWREAAGAYRIQERGEFLVHSIEGSYSNIVGLPLSLLYGMLRRANYPFPAKL
jgi:septum formation protein